jgi:Na+-driven multidrug efflux pump
MPAIAMSVAVLPFAARLIAEGRGKEVVLDLKRGLLGAVGLSLCIVVPVAWFFAEPIATYLVHEEDTAGVARAVNALFLLPFAAIATVPFLVLRPVFEALQRPRLGVLITLAKSLVLSIPILLAGRHLASLWGWDPLLGILLGMAAAAALASGLVVVASRGLLREQRQET